MARRNQPKSLQLTGDGDLLGTLPYMAPEQIEGEEVDARTDIFSFGVDLYEMITGGRPFSGSTRSALIAAIVKADPLPPSSSRPGISPALERAVDRCLAKDRKDRWQTARDLSAELRWIAAGEPGLRATPRLTRRITWRIVGFSLVAATTIGSLVLAGRSALAPHGATVALYTRVTFRNGAVSSARFTPDGQSFVYSASWEGRPYNVFLGRSGSPDARDLSLEAGRSSQSRDRATWRCCLAPEHRASVWRSNAGAGSDGRRRATRSPRRDRGRRLDRRNERSRCDPRPGGGRPWSVEFPAGTLVHEARAAWSLRVSPDGTRVAFFEGPGLFSTEPESMVTVIDRAGRKTTLSRHWAGLGLAWARSTGEIWFTGTDGSPQAPWLNAVSLAGVERIVQRAPDWLMLHDISADGRVLLSRNSVRVNIACQPPGELKERDFSWRWGATVRGLSADGRTLIFTEILGNNFKSSIGLVYRRHVDGSPAVPLGEGYANALSPDGKWVLAWLKDNLLLMPTGAGSVVTLPKGNLAEVGGASWLDDSKHIVFTGDTGNGKPRGHVQEIPNGIPRAITAEGVALAGKAAARDEQTVLGRSAGRWLLYPLNGGSPQSVPGIVDTDVPIQWSQNGDSTLCRRQRRWTNPARPTDYSDHPRRGRLRPPDAVENLDAAGSGGCRNRSGSVVMTADGQSYCYSFLRRLGDLFVADGLK